MPIPSYPPSRFGITTLALLAAAPLALAAEPAAKAQTFTYHHADVLGTAMDLTVIAQNQADADAAEQAVLKEIARLKGILSAYDATSELSRLNAAPVNGPAVTVSTELIDVLKQYDYWFKQSGGAYSGHAGDVLALWKQAEKDGHVPSDADLLAAAQRDHAPAWEIDEPAKTVRRVSDQQINVDSLGKGYVIDKAVAAATKSPATVQGLLLSIGGDLRTWGQPADGTLWQIGIQDPDHPELNAKPLATLFVGGGESVSSSGAYQRFYTIDGKPYSHIVDARTGKTGRNPAATVVAADSATANALATIGCAMKFTEASQLVRGVSGADSMVITPDGQKVRTDGFVEMQVRKMAAERFAPRLASQFPAGFKLSIDLKVLPGSRRPYVFAWVTDSAGEYVKTLAAYGNEKRWMREMHAWWKFAAQNAALQANTHATQAAGSYPLVWDGTNQRGSGVPLGKYNVWVEVGSEHGPYAAKFAAIDFGKDAATAMIDASSAFAAVALHYGPAGK